MSNFAVIQGRYSCDVVNIATVATSSSRKRKSNHPYTTSKRTKQSIAIKPTSVVTKTLSRLLHSIDNADDVFTIITSCMDEKSSLLDDDSAVGGYDDSKHHQRASSTSQKLSIYNLFCNEVNNELRQKKINNKCTGWKYDAKSCITAMSNAVEVSVYTHRKQQQQKNTARQRSKMTSPATISPTKRNAGDSRSTTPCRDSSRQSLPPCRNAPTETLLLSSTNSFNGSETLSNINPALSGSTDSMSVPITPTSTNTTTSPLLQTVMSNDSDDVVLPANIHTMLPPRSATPTSTRLMNCHLRQNHHSVLEHATATNIVSDDSEMDVSAVASTTKINNDLKTTSSTTIASKNIPSPSFISDQSIPSHVELKPRTDDEIQLQNFWSQFLSYIQFHASVSMLGKQQRIRPKTSSTYDIYKLLQPIDVNDYGMNGTTATTNKPGGSRDNDCIVNEIRDKLRREFSSLYHGITNKVSRLQSPDRNDDGIEVNSLVTNENDLWLQIYINPSYDFEWKASQLQQQQQRRNIISGLKKNKKHMEFTVFIPFSIMQQQHVAVSSGRMKSKVKYVSYALSAIEGTFASTTTSSGDALADLTNPEKEDNFTIRRTYITTQNQATTPRYEKCLSGTNPYGLFQSLNEQTKTTKKQDVRQHNDPIANLLTAATECLYAGSDRPTKSHQRKFCYHKK